MCITSKLNYLSKRKIIKTIYTKYVKTFRMYQIQIRAYLVAFLRNGTPVNVKLTPRTLKFCVHFVNSERVRPGRTRPKWQCQYRAMMNAFITCELPPQVQKKNQMSSQSFACHAISLHAMPHPHASWTTDDDCSFPQWQWRHWILLVR